MPIQPNPFVNPSQRGVELPAGCKDLMDVLKKGDCGTTDHGTTRRGETWSGVIGEVGSQFSRVLRSTAGRSFLVIMIPAREIFLMALKAGGHLRLTFAVQHDQKEAKDAVAGIFDSPLPRYRDGLREVFDIELKLSEEEGEKVRRLLAEGFGVGRETPMLYHFSEDEGEGRDR